MSEYLEEEIRKGREEIKEMGVSGQYCPFILYHQWMTELLA